MPTAATLDHARPHCPGTAKTRRSRGPGSSPITEHAPCGKALSWNQKVGKWKCPKHGMVLSGEQAAVQLNETIELPIVEAA